MKRAYNLSPATIATIKRLESGLSRSKELQRAVNALVELAIAELDREIRDARDAELWTQASRDPAFADELQQIDEDLFAFSQTNTVIGASRQLPTIG